MNTTEIKDFELTDNDIVYKALCVYKRRLLELMWDNTADISKEELNNLIDRIIEIQVKIESGSLDYDWEKENEQNKESTSQAN